MVREIFLDYIPGSWHLDFCLFLNGFLKQETEWELCSLSVLWLYSDLAVEGLHDVFRDYQTESNALCVHLASVLQCSKQSEKLDSVLLLDADSRVYDWDYNLVLFRVGNENAVYTVFFIEVTLSALVFFTTLAVRWKIVFVHHSPIVLLDFLAKKGWHELHHDHDGPTTLCKFERIGL